MSQIIYYAHSMLIYDTAREQEELARLQAYFQDMEIYNPNQVEIQQAKDPMHMCLHIVSEPYVSGLAFSHQFRRIPSGVYAEIRVAQKRHKPIYIINADGILRYTRIPKLLKKDRTREWARV